MPGREFLYNQNEDLCFWPVDNSDNKDPNISRLQSIIVDAVKTDELDYLDDPIPRAWLTMCDKLAEHCEDESVLCVHSSDDRRFGGWGWSGRTHKHTYI